MLPPLRFSADLFNTRHLRIVTAGEARRAMALVGWPRCRLAAQIETDCRSGDMLIRCAALFRDGGFSLVMFAAGEILISAFSTFDGEVGESGGAMAIIRLSFIRFYRCFLYTGLDARERALIAAEKLAGASMVNTRIRERWSAPLPSKILSRRQRSSRLSRRIGSGHRCRYYNFRGRDFGFEDKTKSLPFPHIRPPYT